MDIYNDISLSTGSSYMAENDGLKQTFPQRRCADGQEAHEKVLSIADHWRTANQKTTVTYHLKPVRIVMIKSLQTINVGESVD